ncbi:glycoside hydrolase family 65 protein [Butyrivibrio sp. LC3010]|uniref:glycoside hydrolase family 65 protein n=1 Tax=Butyrivibrio sp. LC3010 TaxID=1280680 RepID=UPI00040C70FB|nr:glycosyl hydrolase family 65 protein [Butyrivibrio sp. LC3010]
MRSNRIITKKQSFDKAELRLNETLFCNANGYIGVRGTLEEGVPDFISTMRGMYLGGVYEIIPMKQAESLCNLIEKKQTMLNVADTQTIYLCVNGEKFDIQSTQADCDRILNMDEGYTLRTLAWKDKDSNRYEASIKRVAHFEHPNLFTIEYRVRSLDRDAEILFDSRHIADVKNYSDPDDPRLADESEAYLEAVMSEMTENSSIMLAKTKVSGISIASAVGHKLLTADEKGNLKKIEINGDQIDRIKNGEIRGNFRVHIEKGQEAVYVKYTVFADSIRESDPKNKSREILCEVMGKELSELYKAQKDVLTGFWQRADMEIQGDDELDLAMCFNMYQLFQSSPRMDKVSMAAKGLSGEGYEGHYFWDTEMYALPFFILTDTELARRILAFRYETLDKARENAGLLGHKKGALYPWRTITGEECSGYFPSGTAAYHINGAISNAVISYYLATGDTDYLLSEGEEILLEIARLWLDTGNYDRDGKFVINEVTGPDEYTCMTDNNFYTNCCAAHGMKWAVKIFRELGNRDEMKALSEKLGIDDDEIEKISEAAEKMYLPYDEKFGISPQDDSFLQKPVWDLENTPKEEFPLLLHYHPLHLYRYQVCKQADTVLAHFLYPDSADKETMEKSFRYYEKITTHDSSLSTCVFSMQASRLGLYDEAEKYFGDSAKLDLYNRHGNSGDGVHTANMGGAYMAIVYGFAGIRINEDGLSVDPFLPKSFKGYSFNFCYRGRSLRVEVKSGEASLKLLDGEKIDFCHNGDKYSLNSVGAVSTWKLKQ